MTADVKGGPKWSRKSVNRPPEHSRADLSRFIVGFCNSSEHRSQKFINKSQNIHPFVLVIHKLYK